MQETEFTDINQQMRIAKSIHLIFLRRDEAIPSLFRECKHRIREMHPSWNITLWNEESGLQYLKNELSEYVQAKIIVCNKVSAEMERRINAAYAIHYFCGTWFSDNTN